jgi:O-antigen/teichoic acid export membrane protein
MFFMLNSADRFFLVRFADQEEVGVYGLGYRLATLVGLFSLTPLYRVWSARMYDIAGEADAPVVFGKVTTYLLGCYLSVGLAVCLLQDELVACFAGPKFAAAGLIVAPVVLAYWFQSLGVLMDAGFYIRRWTQGKLWTALASAAVMLLLYAALIPPYASLGAALATLIGFAFHALFTYCVTQRFFPVRYEFGRLAWMLGLAGLLWACSRLFDSSSDTILLKVGLWSLWPTGLWLFGVVSPAEKRWARDRCLQVFVYCGIVSGSQGAAIKSGTTSSLESERALSKHAHAELVRPRG